MPGFPNNQFQSLRGRRRCGAWSPGRWASRSTRARSPRKISTPATMNDAPITPGQKKTTRELLGWPQMDVANRVGLTEWVVGFFERGERLIRARYLRRVRSILESAGVEFIAVNGGGAGVRLKEGSKRWPSPASDIGGCTREREVRTHISTQIYQLTA